MMTCFINDWYVPALVDSGASRCVISKTLLNHLYFNALPDLVLSNLTFCVADRRRISVLGTVDLRVGIFGTIILQEFAVLEDVEPPLIIGCDLMAQFSVVQRNVGIWMYRLDSKFFPCEQRLSVSEDVPPLCPLNFSGLEVFRESLQLQLPPSLLGIGELERFKLVSFLEQNREIFSDKPGLTPLLNHFIETGNSRPIFSQPYRASPQKREIISNLIDEMLDDDIIEASPGSWSSPVVIVPKPKPNEWRFCVDYRALNAITERDVFPTPPFKTLLII